MCSGTDIFSHINPPEFFSGQFIAVNIDITGLSLLGVGINYFCGGSGKADYGSLQNLFLGFVVLIVIILLKHFAPQDSVLSSAAILFGILAGYAVAVVMTLVLPTVGINADGAEYTYSWVVNFEQIKNAVN